MTESGGTGAVEAYDLGIDLGTTYTAAAVRPHGRPVEVVRLDDGADEIPSVVLVTEDGRVFVGADAEREAPASPDRVVREFKRRLGDNTPMLVGEHSFSADGVAAETVRWVADRVAEQRGAPPHAVALSHPAGWGAFRRRVFLDALAEVGVSDVVLVTEPEAAATAYGADGRVPAGHVVGVYDLGGGTFDAAVVRGRADGDGVDVLGQAQGLEALGGVDFDEALFWHVCTELGGAVAALDPADPATRRAVTALRRATVRAKEELSGAEQAVIDVDLPGARARLRIRRSGFEQMIEPALRQTADVLGEVLDAVSVGPDALDGLLLVGGSSRIPLVAKVLAEEFRCPVAVDEDPTTMVARGAALAAGREDVATRVRPAPVVARHRRTAAVSTRDGGWAGRSRAGAGSTATVADPTSTATPVETETALRPDDDTAPGGPAGGGTGEDPLGPIRPPVRTDGSVWTDPARAVREEDAPLRRRRRRTIALVVGTLLVGVLVLFGTVPIIPGDAAPAPAAPTAPAAPAPGAPAAPAPAAPAPAAPAPVPAR